MAVKGAEFSLDAKQSAELKKALRDSIGIMGRTGTQALEHFAIRFAKSARSRQKKGKKTRDVIKNPEYDRKSNPRAAKYLIVVRKQGKPDQHLPKRAKTKKGDPRTQISNAGLGKLIWGGVIAKLGKSGALGGTARIKRTGKRYVHLRRNFQKAVGISGGKIKNRYFISIGNTASYIATHDPGLESYAMQKAIGALQNQAARTLDGRLKRRFK